MLLTENNLMRVTEIKRATRKSPRVKEFFFHDEPCSKGRPGQFVMIWLPGFDEIPMSLSSTHPNGLVSVAVAKVGEATELFHKKREGDLVGVRGPLGNSFQLERGNVLLIGGGTGIAPLAFLAEELAGLKTGITFLMGAKTKEELLFLSRIKRLSTNTKFRVFTSTEDGSFGHKGVVTELAEEILEKEEFDTIYACGKELMLLKIFRLAQKHRTPLQVSLERLMRCAIGLCGSCVIGKYRVCVDGPVFTDRQLKEVESEFGRFRRSLDGSKVPLQSLR